MNTKTIRNIHPFCSIIVLNYQGENVIGSCLNSIWELDYPKNRLEVIVVDNNSLDNSKNILSKIAKDHSNLKLIFLDKNYGFSIGNNFGIKEAKGEYVVLLNNDCTVEKNWLKELVKTATNHPKVFAVNSKILLFPKYINLSFDFDPCLTPLYSWISKSNMYFFNKKRIYLTLMKNETGFQSEIPFDPKEDLEIELLFVFNCGKAIKSKDIKSLIKFHTQGVEIAQCNSAKNEVSYKVKIDLKNKEVNKQAFSKIQNAGIMPFQDGYARDIGAIVKDSRQYYEHDKGLYDKEVEVYANCGAAIFMNKAILDKIGYLDESFFMYYEDIELSERARLRGYKIYYSPKALVRHLHALSSGEGSNFFVYHVEKGRLLHVFLNFPLRVFFDEYIKVILLIIYGIAKAILRLRHIRSFSKKQNKEKPSYKLKIQMIYVLSFFITRFIWLAYLRYKKNTALEKGAVLNNYNEILSGRWYFE